MASGLPEKLSVTMLLSERNSQRISLGYKKNTIPMILSNPVGWVRDGDIQIFTYYIKV